MKILRIGHARAGFTLIEILVALAIVALVAVTLGPWAFRQYQSGQKKTAVQSVRGLKSTIENYYLDIGEYPESLRDLVKPPADEEQVRNWNGPYMEAKEVPKDPWGNPFKYEKTPEGEHPYELFSYGPKGRAAPPAERIDAWSL